MATKGAVIQSFRDAGKRTKVQFKSGKYSVAFMNFNRKLVNQGRAKWYWDDTKEVVGRSIQPKKWLITAEVIPVVRYKDDTEPRQAEMIPINLDATGNQADAEARLNQAIEDVLLRLGADSPTQEIVSHQVSNRRVVKKPTQPRAVVGNGGELTIDGFEPGRNFMPLDEKYGCGYYAIEHRYGKEDGWIKKAKKHIVFNYLRDTYHGDWRSVVDIARDLSHEEKLEYFGLSPEDLVKWGKWTNTSVYVINEDRNLYEHGVYKAVNPRKNRPLALLLKNGHYHLLEDTQMVKSLGAKFKNSTAHQKGVWKSARGPTDEAEVDEANIVRIPHETALSEMASIIRSTGLIPRGKMIKLNGDSNVASWTIGDTTYVVDTEGHSMMRRVNELNDWNQSGQTLVQWVAKLVNENLKETHKSKIPKPTYDILVDYLDYNHLGPTPHFRHYCERLMSQGQSLPEDIYGFDINAQDYTSMKKPTEDWAIMDFNSVPTPVPKEGKLPFGFYFIDTYDEKLATGKGLYCLAFTEMMMSEGLCSRDDLLYYIPCIRGKQEQVARLLWFIDIYCKNDKRLLKIARNTIAGTLGKSQTKIAHGYIVEPDNVVEAMNYFCKMDEWKDSNPFLRTSEYYEKAEVDGVITHTRDESGDLYLYGSKKKLPRSQNYLPMYLQILQWGAMRLYSYVKPHWRHVVYRKRDAFFVKPYAGFQPPSPSDELGRLKPEAPPKMLFASRVRERIVMPDLKREWTEYNGLDSTNSEAILAILESHGGAEIDARAGYGKTHVTKEVIKLAEAKGWNVACCAFTNKAANNLGGRTIHRLFGMKDIVSEPDPAVISRLSRQYDLIVFDEKSMIPADIWNHITNLETRILVVGDWRQLPPVEKDKPRQNYRDHPALFHICKGQRILLKRGEHCRYDTELEEASNNVAMFIPTFSDTMTEMNIAFTNKKMVEVNQMVLKTLPYSNKKIKIPNAPTKWTTSNKSDERAWAGQKWKIFVGQPLLIAKKNTNLMAMKNEQVCIHAIDDEKIILEDEVGEVAIKDFWEYLRPAYCITTHKAQGDTFKEDYSIWEWFRMDKEMRYTALTRAQSLRQIHFRK